MPTLRTPLVLAAVCMARAATLGSQTTLDAARELYQAGRIREAVEAYRRVAIESEPGDPTTAGTARNNACVLLMNAGDHRAALQECEHALRSRRAAGDPVRLAPTLNNLGLVLQYLGRFAESERHFEEALAINVEFERAEWQAVNHANLGVLATQAGWYAKAIDGLSRALAIAESHPDEPWAAEQRRLATLNLGVVFERLGAFEEALSRYRAVFEERDELAPERRAGLLLNLGVVYRNLGDPVRALSAFEEATAAYELAGDRAALSNAWLNVGIVQHLNLDDLLSAERAYRKALALAEGSGDRTEETLDLYHLGRLLLERHRAAEAQEAFTRCLSLAQETGSVDATWAAREGLSRVARAQGDLQGALAELRRAVDAIEGVRGSLARGPLRAGYFAEKRFVYAATVEVLAGLEAETPGAGHAEEALAVVERAKARVLLDALGGEAGFVAPLPTRAIAERLGEDALIEYFVGEDNLFVWRVYRGRVEMESLGPAHVLLDEAESVHRSLARGEDPSALALGALSASLLHGAGPLVATASEIRIAPDGRLHYLPFELLSVPGGGAAPLVEAVTLSYLPSGSALGRLRRGRTPRGPALIGFGDPELAREAGAPPTPADLLVSRFDLRPLPAAADELAAVARWLPGRAIIRTGKDATEEAFADLAAGGASVLHIVSHTVMEERAGQGAAILLTRGEGSDGLLRPEEIAHLELPVELAVLAACRTALGPESGGDALATLTGSFLAAGSSAVVATLWDVGDAETRAFMEQFYFHLREGESATLALRRAKLAMLGNPEWRRAHLWAAYVLVGDAGPVCPPPHRNARYTGAAAALAAATLAWLAVRRVLDQRV